MYCFLSCCMKTNYKSKALISDLSPDGSLGAKNTQDVNKPEQPLTQSKNRECVLHIVHLGSDL